MFHNKDTIWNSVISTLSSDRKQEAGAELSMLRNLLVASKEREIILQHTIIQLGYDKNVRARLKSMSEKFQVEKAQLVEENRMLTMELARVVGPGLYSP